MKAILALLNAFSSAGLAAVLNTLWLALGVAALIWVVLRQMPRVNAATRHAVWWAVLALVAAMPLVTLLHGRHAAMPSSAGTKMQVQTHTLSSPPAKPSSPAQRAVPGKPVKLLREGAPEAADSSPATVFAPITPAVQQASSHADEPLHLRVPIEFHPKSWPSSILFLWIVVSCLLSGRLVLSYVHLRGLRRRARPAGADLLARFDQHVRNSRTSRAPQLLVSDEVISPLAAGFLHPVVILPEHLLEEIGDAELDYVLLHELAHIARRDDWTNLLGRLASAFLVLHPVAAWVLHRIKREREIACDDWVVAASGSATGYAATLARIFEFCCMRRRELLATEMAHPSSNLVERIEILLRPRSYRSAGASMSRVLLCIAAGFALLGFGVRVPRWIAFAQDSTAGQAVPAAPSQVSAAHNVVAPEASSMEASASGATPFAPYRVQSSANAGAEDKAWRHGWKLSREGSSSTQVQFSLISRNDAGGDWTNTESVPLSRLRGLALSDLDHDGAVKFEYVRNAGRILCEGQVANGSAAGPFTVVIDPAFASALEKMGYAALRNEDAFSLVISDVTLDYARAIKDTGLTSSVSDLVGLRNHGVGAEYVRAVRQEGFTNLTAGEISYLRDHGVQPAYLKEIKDADPKLNIEAIDSLYDHGVKADYYKSMKASAPQLSIEEIDSLYDHGVKAAAYKGFTSTDPRLSIEEINSLYDHGVQPEYYRSIKAADPKLSIEQIDSLYDHGVKPEYYRSMKSAAPNLSIEQIDSLYDHGVEPESYKGFASIAPSLSIEQIDSLRNHGVEPAFYQGTKAVDSAVSIEEINGLRDHGVEPEYLKEMRALPDGFSISDISQLRDHGITARYVRNLHEMGMKNLTAAQIVHLREAD